MKNLFNKNGLGFWSQQEIKLRNSLIDLFVDTIWCSLKASNKSFEIVQVESPILTPTELINKEYVKDHTYNMEDLTLRPETTLGSYLWAEELLNPHSKRKYNLPLIIWQVGKSFRKEQNRPEKEVKLKEFYQLEFQIIFSETTKSDYLTYIIDELKDAVLFITGDADYEDSDRLPSYSTRTVDVTSHGLELMSISNRTDFKLGKVLEVAIGLDRCLYLHKLR